MISVILILAGTGIIDRVVARANFASAAASFDGGYAVAPTDAESSAWYCTGGTGSAGALPVTIVLTNSTIRDVKGSLTADSAGGAANSVKSVPVSVPAEGQLAIIPSQLDPSATWVAATVILDAGGVSASELVGNAGSNWSSAPCSSETSASWYFPTGTTSGTANTQISLYNPGLTTAVVDTTFATPNGRLQPPSDEGVEVPPGGVVVENLADHLSNMAGVASTVTARSGEVVAGELQETSTGVALRLGSPATSTSWAFPETTDSVGSTVTFVVYDPGTQVAHVSLSLGLTQGSTSPLTTTVQPGTTADIVATGQARIPQGATYASILESSGGVGVVVDRVVQAPSGSAGEQSSDVAGVPGGAKSWIVPLVPQPGTGVSSMAVENLGTTATPVTISLLVSGRIEATDSTMGKQVAPGGSLVLSPSGILPLGVSPLMVRAENPIVVTIDALPAGAPGTQVLAAFPVSP